MVVPLMVRRPYRGYDDVYLFHSTPSGIPSLVLFNPFRVFHPSPEVWGFESASILRINPGIMHPYYHPFGPLFWPLFWTSFRTLFRTLFRYLFRYSIRKRSDVRGRNAVSEEGYRIPQIMGCLYPLNEGPFDPRYWGGKGVYLP